MFEKIEKNGVAIYRSTILEDAAHGFSTREGGVSTGALRSLNVGEGRGDDDGRVAENRARFARACGFGDRRVIFARQIHSPRIEYVTPSNADADFECDGFLTDAPGVPIAVKSADCVPILLYEPDAGVAAAVHAGWRGTAAGIAGVAVERMCRLGAKRDRIRAAIGPSICAGCFEVGDDFPDRFADIASTSPHHRMRVGAAGMISDFISRGGDGVLRCDLQSINERLLVLCGVHQRCIDVAGICTKERGGEFYSHRRDGDARGVMASAIMI